MRGMATWVWRGGAAFWQDWVVTLLAWSGGEQPTSNARKQHGWTVQRVVISGFWEGGGGLSRAGETGCGWRWRWRAGGVREQDCLLARGLAGPK